MAGNVNVEKVWTAAMILKESEAYKKHNIRIRDSKEEYENIARELQEAYEIANIINDMAALSIENESSTEQIETSANDFNPGGQETLFSGELAPKVVEEINGGIRIAPAEGSAPLSLLLDKDVETLAFPSLFGGAILSPEHNGSPVTFSAIAKFLARHHDRRFAKRTDFLLFLDRKKQLLTLASHVNIMMRMFKIRIERPLNARNLIQKTH